MPGVQVRLSALGDTLGNAHFHLGSGVCHDRRWDYSALMVQAEQAYGCVQFGLVNADHGGFMALDAVVGLLLLLVHVVHAPAVPVLDGFQDSGPHLVGYVWPLGGLALLVLVLILVLVLALLGRRAGFSRAVVAGAAGLGSA
jgi:hypothetical protein